MKRLNRETLRTYTTTVRKAKGEIPNASQIRSDCKRCVSSLIKSALDVPLSSTAERFPALFLSACCYPLCSHSFLLCWPCFLALLLELLSFFFSLWLLHAHAVPIQRVSSTHSDNKYLRLFCRTIRGSTFEFCLGFVGNQLFDGCCGSSRLMPTRNRFLQFSVSFNNTNYQ